MAQFSVKIMRLNGSVLGEKQHSDVKSLIQGLGRIDRIDSPNSKIHYFTFDLPGLVLSSDHTARKRVESIALLSGVGADDLPSELVEFAAGDLTDLVLEQVRKPRILRTGNYFDLIEGLRRELPDVVIDRVRAARPTGLWGAELCQLRSTSPVTILVLGGRKGEPGDPTVQPPRLLAIREDADHSEIIGDQADAARLLSEAWAETRRQGLQDHAPTASEVSGILTRLGEALPQLTHWDIRPARTVSLLASLARFLTGAPALDDGRGLLGDLTLPALEKLAETWAHELDPFWIEAKQAVSQKSASGKAIPDYLGIDAIEAELGQQPDEVIADVRQRMTSLYERCRLWSADQPTDILSRIAVVFDGRPR